MTWPTTTALVLGLLNGLLYLIVAVGLILVYRASRVLNFALVEGGVLGASFLALAMQQWHLPYGLAFLVAVVAGGAASGVVQAAVVHRLGEVPRVIAVIATVGFAQLFLLLAAFITPGGAGGVRYPSPDFLPSLSVGPLTLSPAYTGIALAAPILTVLVVLALDRTRLGLGVRATSSNRPAARLAGIPASRMTALAWIGAGMLTTIVVVLLLPTRGASVGMTLGPVLLLRALTVAVIARLESIPVAAAAAVSLGLVEAVVVTWAPQPGMTDLVLLVALLVVLLLQRDVAGRTAPRERWTSITGFPPLSPAGRRRVRLASWTALGVGAVLVAAVVAAVSNANAARLTWVLGVAVVTMGVLIITGLAGQLSLAQFSIAGVSVVASSAVATATGQFFLAFAAAAVAGSVVSLIVGLPALRLRGPFLAATTMAFAVATSSYLLPTLLGSGVTVGQPIIGGVRFDDGRTYLALAAAVTVLAAAILLVLRHGSWGRMVRAVRDNEDAARAMGVNAARTKMTAFAVAGAYAGIGGAVLAHSQSVVVPGLFPLSGNTETLAAAVIGGLDLVVGPVLGALYVVGVPQFLPLDSAGLAASALGWLLLLLYVPRGLPSLLAPLRSRVARDSGGAEGEGPPPDGPRPLPLPRDNASGLSRAAAPARRAAALQLVGLSKAYGGVRAVDDVDLTIAPGEVVGLIGPNGAGKSTLFELVAGAVRPDAGVVLLDGVDITTQAPQHRLSRGISRSFQDAALYPSLTTAECVAVACSRTPGLGRRERRDRGRVQDTLAQFGLERYEHLRVAELSTGTRRIVELACCAALRPRLLLLDEPAAGVAQAEVEVLADVLRGVVDALGATLVVIEHDIALIRRLADRVVAMDLGHVVADGTADAVLAHPQVVAAYLGDGGVATTRSGSRPDPGAKAMIP